MLADVEKSFRARLSEELRTAMIKRDRESISTIRCMISDLDKAGAVAPEVANAGIINSPTEVVRRRLNHQDVMEILQLEIAAREAAACGYERIGDTVQAKRVRDGSAMVGNWMVLLAQSSTEFLHGMAQ